MYWHVFYFQFYASLDLENQSSRYNANLRQALNANCKRLSTLTFSLGIAK